MTDAPDRKRMRLRYAGICRSCGAEVPAGQQAVYLRTEKKIECLACADATPPSGSSVTGRVTAGPVSVDRVATGSVAAGPDTGEPIEAPIDPPVDAGAAGASARREYERRVAKREQRIRAAHPKLGGLILALSDEPQSTRAWEQGARGEKLLAGRLDTLGARGVILLHDRRIPGTRANIDHIALSAAGAFVIDAKRYTGRPTLKVEGGLLRPRTEKLLVGRRDCTKLVDGVRKQVALVHAALATVAEFGDVPVHGMLCFVQADWPLIGGAFSTGGVQVLWPAKAAEKITAAGTLDADLITAVHRHLASAFPTA